MTIRILLAILLFSTPLFSSEFASIKINTADKYPGIISPMLYGAFMEFTLTKVNGPLGMHAQELENRGMDFICHGIYRLPCHWEKYGNSDDQYYNIVEGGYNPNGRFGQFISNPGNTITGIAQEVYIKSGISHTFYIYLKSFDIIDPIYFAIIDPSGNESYTAPLGSPDFQWNKHQISIPAGNYNYTGKIAIYSKSKGSFYLDEASFMADDNMFGIRKEYYDLYKYWNPGMLRYPGGWMADINEFRWYNMIGDIDKRLSPIVSEKTNSQRVDFGIDEYMAFCNDLNIEPQYTVNFGSANPEEAAELVIYLNGDGKKYPSDLRISNGYPDPYNVKYFEIGNEQYIQWAVGYRPPKQMAADFRLFDIAMKNEFPNILTIIDGHFWGHEDFFNTVTEIAGDRYDYYGWHLDAFFKPEIAKNDTAGYLSILGCTVRSEKFTDDIMKWAKNNNLEGKINQCNTEWFPVYGDDYNWHSHERLYTLEPALWAAAQINVWRERASFFHFAERTSNCGMFVTGYNKTGKRIISAAPSLHAMAMLSKYSGTAAVKTAVECSTYDVPEAESIWLFNDVPYIDAGATKTDDSLFITVINRHPAKIIFTDMLIDNIVNFKATVHTLYSEDFLDANTPDEPNKIIPQTKEQQIEGYYYFPPHSLTIFAISLDELIELPKIDITEAFVIAENPVSSELKLIFNGKIIPEAIIKIYDVNGKIAISEILNGDYLQSINISRLSSGFYYIKAYYRGKTVIKPFIKATD